MLPFKIHRKRTWENENSRREWGRGLWVTDAIFILSLLLIKTRKKNLIIAEVRNNKNVHHGWMNLKIVAHPYNEIPLSIKQADHWDDERKVPQTHTWGERSQTQSAITQSREIFTCHLERQDHEDRTHTSVCPGEGERRGRAEGGMRTLWDDDENFYLCLLWLVAYSTPLCQSSMYPECD